MSQAKLQIDWKKFLELDLSDPEINPLTGLWKLNIIIDSLAWKNEDLVNGVRDNFEEEQRYDILLKNKEMIKYSSLLYNLLPILPQHQRLDFLKQFIGILPFLTETRSTDIDGETYALNKIFECLDSQQKQSLIQIYLDDKAYKTETLILILIQNAEASTQQQLLQQYADTFIEPSSILAVLKILPADKKLAYVNQQFNMTEMTEQDEQKFKILIEQIESFVEVLPQSMHAKFFTTWFNLRLKHQEWSFRYEGSGFYQGKFTGYAHQFTDTLKKMPSDQRLETAKFLSQHLSKYSLHSLVKLLDEKDAMPFLKYCKSIGKSDYRLDYLYKLDDDKPKTSTTTSTTVESPKQPRKKEATKRSDIQLPQFNVIDMTIYQDFLQKNLIDSICNDISENYPDDVKKAMREAKADLEQLLKKECAQGCANFTPMSRTLEINQALIDKIEKDIYKKPLINSHPKLNSTMANVIQKLLIISKFIIGLVLSFLLVPLLSVRFRSYFFRPAPYHAFTKAKCGLMYHDARDVDFNRP